MSASPSLRRMGAFARRVVARVVRGRGGVSADPKAAFARYREKAAACGLQGLHLFLSFDCDTDWDIDVVGALDAFLRDRNIVPTYAVPGAQLERGRAAYAAVAASGREFLNHGARAHAEWRDDRYVPVTFYQEMREDEIVADIERGHRIVADVTGQIPVGFRAPHFGGFQQDKNLALIYRTIEKLNYRYSSTTLPEKALAYGPAYRVGKIVELPTSGSARYPHLILDTWTQLTDRRHYALGESYYQLFAETIDVFTRLDIPALLTWYGDPSHAWNQTAFLKAMDLIAERGIHSVSGGEAVRLCSAALRTA